VSGTATATARSPNHVLPKPALTPQPQATVNNAAVQSILQRVGVNLGDVEEGEDEDEDAVQKALEAARRGEQFDDEDMDEEAEEEDVYYTVRPDMTDDWAMVNKRPRWTYSIGRLWDFDR